MSGSVFKHERRVCYADCTVGNHVYYSRYLDMLETARGELFRQAGFPLLALQEAGTAFPVIGLNISYKSPARYDDVVTIELFLTELAGIRLTVAFRILNPAGELVAEGETRHVCASTDERPKRLPKELIAQLQPFLNVPDHAA